MNEPTIDLGKGSDDDLEIPSPPTPIETDVPSQVESASIGPSNESNIGVAVGVQSPGCYRNLACWQLAVKLAAGICHRLKKLASTEGSFLGEELSHLAIRLPNEMANGRITGSERDFKNSLCRARQSLAQVDTLLSLAFSAGYLPKEDVKPLRDHVGKVWEAVSNKIKELADDPHEVPI